MGTGAATPAYTDYDVAHGRGFDQPTDVILRLYGHHRQKRLGPPTVNMSSPTDRAFLAHVTRRADELIETVPDGGRGTPARGDILGQARIEPRNLPNSARAQLVTEIPPAILDILIGISPSTASRWATPPHQLDRLRGQPSTERLPSPQRPVEPGLTSGAPGRPSKANRIETEIWDFLGQVANGTGAPLYVYLGDGTSEGRSSPSRSTNRGPPTMSPASGSGARSALVGKEQGSAPQLDRSAHPPPTSLLARRSRHRQPRPPS